MPGVLIAESVYRTVTLRHTQALIRIMSEVPKGEQVELNPQWNDSFIERPRGVLATRLLEDPELSEFDVLVTLDDDIGLTPEMFWKVVRGARETGDIVSGAYATRSRHSHLACRPIPGVPLYFTNGGPSNLVEIQYATTGLMAVPRAILEQMRHHHFDDANGGHQVHRYTHGLTDPDSVFWGFYTGFDIQHRDGTLERLSEDFAICERARQLGHKVYVDTSILLEHEGPIEVTVADIPRIGQGLVPTGEPLLDSLPVDLAAYLGGEPEMLRAAMFGARELYSRLWNEWRALHPDTPEKEWYKLPEVGYAYLLELMRWHLTGGGTPRFLAEMCAGKLVLDYGCGIATFGLLAAKAGARAVLAVDVNETTTEYARFRARHHRLENIFTAQYMDLELPDRQLHAMGPFDAVHCWHVLEHVPDPMAVVRELHSLLNDGGLLIADWDFHRNQDDPMHHELGEFEIADFREALEQAGFRYSGTPHVWEKV